MGIMVASGRFHTHSIANYGKPKKPPEPIKPIRISRTKAERLMNPHNCRLVKAGEIGWTINIDATIRKVTGHWYEMTPIVNPVRMAA